MQPAKIESPARSADFSKPVTGHSCQSSCRAIGREYESLPSSEKPPGSTRIRSRADSSPVEAGAFCDVCCERLASKNMTLYFLMPSGVAPRITALRLCARCEPVVHSFCVLSNWLERELSWPVVRRLYERLLMTDTPVTSRDSVAVCLMCLGLDHMTGYDECPSCERRFTQPRPSTAPLTSKERS